MYGNDLFANTNITKGSGDSASKRKISVTSKLNSIVNMPSDVMESNNNLRVKNYSPSNSFNNNMMKNSGLGSR